MNIEYITVSINFKSNDLIGANHIPVVPRLLHQVSPDPFFEGCGAGRYQTNCTFIVYKTHGWILFTFSTACIYQAFPEISQNTVLHFITATLRLDKPQNKGWK